MLEQNYTAPCPFGRELAHLYYGDNGKVLHYWTDAIFLPYIFVLKDGNVNNSAYIIFGTA